MGQAVSTAADEQGVDVVGQCDIGGDLKVEAREADVIIDFSFHETTEAVIETAKEMGKRLVIGTTGHNDERRADLRKRAGELPTVWAGNYSIGVNLLFFLTQRAASVLDETYDAEIVELHHRLKKDAPSGTAADLYEIILKERGLGFEALRHGRSGVPGERSTKEVGVHAIRGGDSIGDHTVLFAGQGERIELTHRASNRQIYSTGAIRAARWIMDQSAGVYDMQDVLGFRD